MTKYSARNLIRIVRKRSHFYRLSWPVKAGTPLPWWPCFLSLGYQMALSIDYYDRLAMVSHWNFTIKFIRGYKVILVTAILHFLAHLWIATSITLLSFVAPSVIVSTKRWNHKSFTDVLSPVAIHLCVLQFFKILLCRLY